MGKDWDHDKGGRLAWIAWMTSVMQECLRVLKPGAHGLVWALPRTSHWTATALEDAGFEVRDVVTHLFGSGFPKSLDVSKAIDKQAGAKRTFGPTVGELSGRDTSKHKKAHEVLAQVNGWDKPTSLPATDAAKQWAGFGTALKPASEHWILVRKPCSEKTVAANVLKWGCGALNIDASRIEAETRTVKSGNSNSRGIETMNPYTPWDGSYKTEPRGRFPANLVLSGDAPEMLDEQSLAGGMHGAGKAKAPDEWKEGFKGYNASSYHMGMERKPHRLGDSGGASRFFYCAKISKSERNAGCEINGHPTVKPKKLMQYLIRMVTPPGGTTLDPFMGSGSTGVAAVSEGFEFVGIERDADYHAIAEKRIEHARMHAVEDAS